jgi:TetR/AcrR family transcriptional regulator, regulator of cefoperazone and chloramphenicol sensitivity
MKTPRKDSEHTRQALLSAGREIFATKGYRNTTIAEICERAGANVAAVNYHFGDKANLYRESWRYAFLKSMEAYPPDGGVSADAPPEERLRGQVTALLNRIADKDNTEFFIVLKELANPTGLLDQAIRDEVKRFNKRLETVVRELLGDKAPDTQVQFYVISIITQCVNMAVAEISRDAERRNKFGWEVIGNTDAYIDHVVQLVLAGISATRKKAGESVQPDPARRREPHK